VVAHGEVGVQPPTQVAVKALGAIDVRNSNDDDLELHVDPLRSRRLYLAARFGIAQAQLLGLGTHLSTVPT